MKIFKNSLSVEDEVLISLNSTLRKGKKCSFGDLVRECFGLFPETFSMIDIPEWPDSLKLDRPLRKLREKGYITGSPVTYFNITDFGLKIIENLHYKNGLKVPANKKPTRSPGLIKVEEILNGEDYLNYLKNPINFKPNNMKIRASIRLTLETPKPALINLLKNLRNTALKLNNTVLINYLDLYIKTLRENFI